MKNKLYPGEWKTSAYDIEYERLYEEGYRGLVFDIDNTLVPHDAPGDKRSKELFCRLKSLGFQCCLLSNNGEGRVKMFNEEIRVNYICKARKPSPGNYKRACEIMNTRPANTIFIGDQVFTDIWGANRAGIRSILVTPMNPKERFQIVLKRYLERPVLYFYKRREKKNLPKL